MAQRTTNGTAPDTWNVLIVEDNPGDVELTQRILQDSKFKLSFNHVKDGEAAMAYLRKEGDHANASKPDVIILDLSMPRMSGYEVLTAINGDPTLADIPVMILTSTQADKSRLFREGFLPSRYGSKPIDLSQFDTMLNELAHGVEIKQPKKWWWPFGN